MSGLVAAAGDTLHWQAYLLEAAEGHVGQDGAVKREQQNQQHKPQVSPFSHLSVTLKQRQQQQQQSKLLWVLLTTKDDEVINDATKHEHHYHQRMGAMVLARAHMRVNTCQKAQHNSTTAARQWSKALAQYIIVPELMYAHELHSIALASPA